MTLTKLVTAEELLQMDEEGCSYELVDGELVLMTPPSGGHGSLAAEITADLVIHVRHHQAGMVFAQDTGFLLRRDPDLVLAPDVAFVSAGRLPPESERTGYWPVVPDLVVEIVSPSDRAGRLLQKVADWLDVGVRLLWLVEPRRRTITVYSAGGAARLLRESDALDGGDVLPGFRMPVAELFH
jgi:Uma2 family endonuclease